MPNIISAILGQAGSIDVMEGRSWSWSGREPASTYSFMSFIGVNIYMEGLGLGQGGTHCGSFSSTG